MPIGLSKAPDTLPKAGQQLWIDTFNGALETCKGTTKECDERAAKIAWDQTKRQFRKVKDKWIAKSEYEDSYHDILLTITKASLQPDGSVRWQAVASDTGTDKASERTSTDLFQDWIDRVTYKGQVDYLPPAKMPFLGISHYPALEGFGEAGTTNRMYIDGDCFKADGVFSIDSPIGEKLLNAVKVELALIKKGGEIEKPIRISAGWWDIQHYHEDSNFLFTRQALTDRCPICEKGQTGDKVYKAGQLDHFAATRVPMNVRTSLELKSMAKITRREDAESIIGVDEAEEMEKRARMVGKSETELPEGMVTKAATKRGGYMRGMRRKKKLKASDVAKALEIEEARLKRLEDDEDEMDDDFMGRMSDVLKMGKDEKEEMLKRFKKTKAEPDPEDEEDEEDKETPKGKKGSKKELLSRFGSKRKKKPPMKEKSIVIGKQEGVKINEAVVAPAPEKMDYGEAEMAYPIPMFGGAKSIKEAEDYIAAQEKMSKMYSYWDMLQSAYGNIQNDPTIDTPTKLKEVSNLFKEMGSKIDTLKAGLSDAFLIQQSTAAYSDFEDDEDEDAELYNDEDDIMSKDQTQVQVADHPADSLKAAVDAALKNKSLGRQGQEEAVQEALNNYTETIKGDLDQANPMPAADQIAGAIEKALSPLAEQLGLLTAKMNQQEQPHPQSGAGLQEVYVPQQKSVAFGQQPQPVQVVEGQLPVSPVTKKPSALTAQIRKSVGLI